MPPAEPAKLTVDHKWPHASLFSRVREALLAAPAYFRSEIRVVGVPATDIQNLNVLLGAAIEEKIVDTLNGMRTVWDPAGTYALYSFVRQPQTFPDVMLRRMGGSDTIMGIELKGWYLLAKEEEPSFRFVVTPAVCAHHDLVVVYPWYLSEVISGSPVLLQPYTEHARYVALYRNWHWEHARKAKGSPNPVILSPAKAPYPSKADNIADTASQDKGQNFGRIARTGLLDDFKQRVNGRQLSGIAASQLRSFLKIFTQSSTEATVATAMASLTREVRATATGSDEEVEALLRRLNAIATIL